MNNGSAQFTNPDKLVALSESLLKQGIAKTKLDADRMAEGMVGTQQNTRPSGQKFDFGFENDKKSNARIDNYSGPATLPNQEQTLQNMTELPPEVPNRFIPEITKVKPELFVNQSESHHEAIHTLHRKVSDTQTELKEQKSVIENLKAEIAHLKQTHEIFHSRMEELHNKVNQTTKEQKPFVGEPAIAQLDTMMQQPANLQAEYQSEEKDSGFVTEVEREVEQAEKKPTGDDLFIQNAQSQNPVPKQEVVDVDLGNIFGK